MKYILKIATFGFSIFAIMDANAASASALLEVGANTPSRSVVPKYGVHDDAASDAGTSLRSSAAGPQDELAKANQKIVQYKAVNQNQRSTIKELTADRTKLAERLNLHERTLAQLYGMAGMSTSTPIESLLDNLRSRIAANVAPEVTRVRADFEANMAAQDRAHAEALGLVRAKLETGAADITALRAELAAKDREHAAAQARIADLTATNATAQATIADLTARLVTSETYGNAAIDLLGASREEARAAVRGALTAKSTAAGAQAEALEKFLSEPPKAKGSRAPRGYGAADSARKPLLAAEHPGASVEATDPATTLAALRADRDRLATAAREVGEKSLTPPRVAVGKKLKDPSYRGTVGLSTSPLRVRGAGAAEALITNPASPLGTPYQT